MKLLTIILTAWTLLSPDGKIAVNVNADKLSGISYSVSCQGDEILAPSPVSMTLGDRTVPLDGKVGDYVALAREKDGVWYAGALTDESARELTLDLSFLPAGSYSVTVFRDGVNADKVARDYKKETFTVASGAKLTISMAPAGGWVAEFRKL